MKNNILITINNLSDIDFYKKLGISNFAFPLKGFTVGIPNTFFVHEITENGYLFINRILDNEGIDELKNILNSIPKNIKGIIFDDLGVYEIIKNMDIEKILYLSHFNTNSESVNIYLDLVDTVILSTDITLDETNNIIKNSKKDISLFTFGYVSTMYSRRLLLDNYSSFYNISKTNPLKISNNGIGFLVYENEFGTVFYYNKVFNGNELLKIKAKYHFINTVFLEPKDVKDFLEGKELINSDKGFLYTETIYKLKGDE